MIEPVLIPPMSSHRRWVDCHNIASFFILLNWGRERSPTSSPGDREAKRTLELGFDVINKYDFKEWLALHGANVKYTVNSAPVRGFYDLTFAYEKGDFSKPNIEADNILRSMMRTALNYKGAIMWKMQAGIGDTMFTPYYKILKARGIKFEFFNKVEEVVADADNIQQIHITQQVALE
mgnify:CR=1 FL=1